MKFGQRFHLFQVPEWEQFYISYNRLKKLFKTAAKKGSHLRTEPNFTGLSTSQLLVVKALTLT
jgi:SPX domain protein involved in polyphosphate accumulation